MLGCPLDDDRHRTVPERDGAGHPLPAYTCDDGSELEALSGPPLQEQLRDLTFVHDPESDTLTDNLGAVWARVGGEDPSPEPTTSDFMWPQSSLEEVRQAQELADAGDPRYTWQVDPKLRSGFSQPTDDTEIVARFLREELGWEAFRFSPIPEDSFGVGATYNNAYIRCAPGRTNPLYPNDPEGCAPTIDELRYETVSLDLGQLVRQDPSGIWVVTGWRTLPPLELVVPPSEAETTELLEAFLQARIYGEGAEKYVDVLGEGSPTGEVPLLYATTTGAPYERSKFELVGGPEWPDGLMQFKVRLFAEGGTTVVEHLFLMNRDETGRLGLEYLFNPDTAPTTENGQVVPVQYSFLDGQVTFHAAYPWDYHPSTVTGLPPLTTLYLDDNQNAGLAVVADPLPVGAGCRQGPAPPDAAALARSIRSDPDLEATAPVAVSVGGIEALRLDVVAAPGGSVCDEMGGCPWWWRREASLRMSGCASTCSTSPEGRQGSWPSRSSLRSRASSAGWRPQHRSWTPSSSTRLDGDGIDERGSRDEDSPRPGLGLDPGRRAGGMRIDLERHETAASVEPSVATVASASPSERAAPFPTAAFADIREDPVSDEAAAEFQAILSDMAGENLPGRRAPESPIRALLLHGLTSMMRISPTAATPCLLRDAAVPGVDRILRERYLVSRRTRAGIRARRGSPCLSQIDMGGSFSALLRRLSASSRRLCCSTGVSASLSWSAVLRPLGQRRVSSAGPELEGSIRGTRRLLRSPR